MPEEAHPLLDLADVPLAELRRRLEASPRATDTTLDAIMRRLFDPRERDLVTVSAFGSAL